MKAPLVRSACKYLNDPDPDPVAVSIKENQFEAQEGSDCPGVGVKAWSWIDQLVKKVKVKLIK